MSRRTDPARKTTQVHKGRLCRSRSVFVAMSNRGVQAVLARPFCCRSFVWQSVKPSVVTTPFAVPLRLSTAAPSYTPLPAASLALLSSSALLIPHRPSRYKRRAGLFIRHTHAQASGRSGSHLPFFFLFEVSISIGHAPEAFHPLAFCSVNLPSRRRSTFVHSRISHFAMPSHQQRSRIPGLTLPDSHIKHLSAPAPSPRLPSLVLPARHPHRRRIQIQSSPPRPRDLPRPSPTKGASLRRRQSSVSIMSPTELFSCRISQASKGTRVVSNSSHGSAVRVLQSRPASRTSSEEPKDVTVGTWDPPRRLALSRLCAGRNGSSSPERPTPTKKVPSPLILRAAGPPVGWIVEQSTPSPTAVPTRHDIEIRVDEEPASLYRPGTCDTDVRSSSASDGLLSVSDPAAGLGSGSDVLSPGGESFCCRGGSFDTSFLPSPSLEPVALPSPSRSFSDDFHPLPGATPLVSAQPTATDSGTFTPGTATLAKPQLPPRSRSGGHGPQSFLDLGNTPTIDRFVFRADYRPVAPVAAQEEAEVGVPKTPPPHEKHGGVEIGPSPRSKRVRSTA